MKERLLKNVCWNWHNPTKTEEELLNEFKNDKRVKYTVFTKQKGKKQKTYHFQGYSEFFTRIRFTTFKNKWNFSDIQSRKGNQLQAIDYILSSETNIDKNIWEFGEKERNYHITNPGNKEIPSNFKKQWIHILENIENHTYKSIFDVKKDYPYVFIHHKHKLQQLINDFTVIDYYNLRPLRVVWMYGKSGSGKSTYTLAFLKKLRYKTSEITEKKASSETEPKIWFDFEDENKKVLVIEEVRRNFPKYNDLIKIIDKKGLLPVKNSHIRNNFELLIINSLEKPEIIYKSLEPIHRKEILRRIYESLPNNLILLVKKNKKQLKTFRKGVKTSVFWKKYHPTLINKTKILPRILK